MYVYNDSESPVWDNSEWSWFKTWQSGKGSCNIQNSILSITFALAKCTSFISAFFDVDAYHRDDCMFTDQSRCEAAGCCFDVCTL